MGKGVKRGTDSGEQNALEADGSSATTATPMKRPKATAIARPQTPSPAQPKVGGPARGSTKSAIDNAEQVCLSCEQMRSSLASDSTIYTVSLKALVALQARLEGRLTLRW